MKTVLLSATYERTTVKILQSMFATGDKWIEIRCDALRREPRFELVSATSYRDKNEKQENYYDVYLDQWLYM